MDGKSLSRWLGLFATVLLLAGQLTTNLPVAAESLPVEPVATAPAHGQPPVLPGEKSPVESVRADVGLVNFAPAADREAWAFAVDSVGEASGSTLSLQQAHVRLQI